MDVGGQRGKGRRWKLSGAPVANIQAYGGRGAGVREESGEGEGEGVGFVEGCRGWTCPGAYEVGPERPAQYFIITLTRW